MGGRTLLPPLPLLTLFLPSLLGVDAELVQGELQAFPSPGGVALPDLDDAAWWHFAPAMKHGTFSAAHLANLVPGQLFEVVRQGRYGWRRWTGLAVGGQSNLLLEYRVPHHEPEDEDEEENEESHGSCTTPRGLSLSRIPRYS